MIEHEDLSNRKFNKWTVIKYDDCNTSKVRKWICKCDCGTEKSVSEWMLLHSKSKSCGCVRNSKLSNLRKLNLVGQKFGELTVLSQAPSKIGKNGKPVTYWTCKCSCGKIKKIATKCLRAGTTVSCGHIGKERRKVANDKRFLDNLNYEPIKNGIIPIKKLQSKAQPNGEKKTVMLFQCYCGKFFTAVLDSVKNGHTSSCGCYKKQKAAERVIDLVGQKFNKLTVIEKDQSRKIGKQTFATWKCLCECGNITTVIGQNLKDGTTKSCGCINSFGNEMVGKYLTEHNIEFQREYSFLDLRSDKNYPLRFDFAIFKNKELLGLIEYQGIQHYQDVNEYFGKQQRLITDPMKKRYCAKNNIKLFEIRYDDDIETRCEEILKELHVNTVSSKAA